MTVKITATVSGVDLTVLVKDGSVELRNQLRGLVVSVLCNQQSALSAMKVEDLA